MYEILVHQDLRGAVRAAGCGKVPFSYTYAGEHHTLNVSHPGAMDFIKGLISEYRALFTSDKFNICCDETYDLGKDRSSALAKEKGEHALYMAHVT